MKENDALRQKLKEVEEELEKASKVKEELAAQWRDLVEPVLIQKPSTNTSTKPVCKREEGGRGEDKHVNILKIAEREAQRINIVSAEKTNCRPASVAEKVEDPQRESGDARG